MAIDREVGRELLAERLKQIASEESLAADSTAPVELQQDSVGRLSRIDAMQQQAMALAAQRRRNAERARIVAAQRRIEDEDYGYCRSCGEEIAEARLRLDPAADCCVACASQA